MERFTGEQLMEVCRTVINQRLKMMDEVAFHNFDGSGALGALVMELVHNYIRFLSLEFQILSSYMSVKWIPIGWFD
ncbi:hypothetical protein HanPSC8_Chr13g0550961 [Helianthus annuus]|nr:hypothetical protein HanPSC8_Chr13g0550961 [Helianthus annuus]